MSVEKTHSAIKHDRVRKRQRDNEDNAHHPQEKQAQIIAILDNKTNLKILELFAGHGNLSTLYRMYGQVDCFDKRLGTGDSYRVFHRLIAEGKKYDVIDIDPYGFPSRFFPDVFLLFKNEGTLFLTFPKPGVQCLNGITQKHLDLYYGSTFPKLPDIIQRIKNYALCHWYELELLNTLEVARMWRMAFHVKRVKATEYCGVRNH